MPFWSVLPVAVLTLSPEELFGHELHFRPRQRLAVVRHAATQRHPAELRRLPGLDPRRDHVGGDLALAGWSRPCRWRPSGPGTCPIPLPLSLPSLLASNNSMAFLPAATASIVGGWRRRGPAPRGGRLSSPGWLPPTISSETAFRSRASSSRSDSHFSRDLVPLCLHLGQFRLDLRQVGGRLGRLRRGLGQFGLELGHRRP